jgi:hypothetical protein
MIHPKKSIVNPTFKFPAAKVNATLRSFMPLLVLPLLLISAPDAFPAQAPALTWQQVLTNLFGRRSQRGGSRGERPICSVTPIVGNNPISPMSIGLLLGMAGLARLKFGILSQAKNGCVLRQRVLLD